MKESALFLHPPRQIDRKLATSRAKLELWKKFKDETPIEPTKENYDSLRKDIEKLRDQKLKQ